MITSLKASAILAPVLLAGTASASDLPTHRVANLASPLPTIEWQGLFVGLNAGVGSAQNCWSYLYNRVGPPAGISGKEGCKSATMPAFGGQIGYNFRAGNLVYGVEISGDLASSKTSTMSDLFVQDAIRTRVSSFYTAAARIGYVYDHYLLYAKSGVAQQKSDYERTVGNPGTTGWIERAGQLRTGLALGAGVERMITAKLSLAAEYDYVNFGAMNKALPTVVTGPSFAGSQITAYVKMKQDTHFVGLRLNYHFD